MCQTSAISCTTPVLYNASAYITFTMKTLNGISIFILGLPNPNRLYAASDWVFHNNSLEFTFRVKLSNADFCQWWKETNFCTQWNEIAFAIQTFSNAIYMGIQTPLCSNSTLLMNKKSMTFRDIEFGIFAIYFEYIHDREYGIFCCYVCHVNFHNF